MTLTQKQVAGKYTRFSFLYNFLEWPLERLWYSHWRKQLLKGVKGKVLEVGVGTGKNLPFYNYSNVDLTAIDISEGMLIKAQKLAKQNGYPVHFKLISSDALPFDDNTFDYIVCTFVLCSVPDQDTMLQEMRHVLKKGGKVLFLEHVLSKNKFIALWQHLHNPITRFLFGFNLNRDTIINIRRNKLRIITSKRRKKRRWWRRLWRRRFRRWWSRRKLVNK